MRHCRLHCRPRTHGERARAEDLKLDTPDGRPISLLAEPTTALAFYRAIKDTAPDLAREVLAGSQMALAERADESAFNKEVMAKFKSFLNLCRELDELRKVLRVLLCSRASAAACCMRAVCGAELHRSRQGAQEL